MEKKKERSRDRIAADAVARPGPPGAVLETVSQARVAGCAPHHGAGLAVAAALLKGHLPSTDRRAISGKARTGIQLGLGLEERRPARSAPMGTFARCA